MFGVIIALEIVLAEFFLKAPDSVWPIVDGVVGHVHSPSRKRAVDTARLNSFIVFHERNGRSRHGSAQFPVLDLDRDRGDDLPKAIDHFLGVLACQGTRTQVGEDYTSLVTNFFDILHFSFLV